MITRTRMMTTKIPTIVPMMPLFMTSSYLFLGGLLRPSNITVPD
jgi:hypothetical protein